MEDPSAPLGFRKEYRFKLSNISATKDYLAFYIIHNYAEIRIDGVLVYSLMPDENNRIGSSPSSNWIFISLDMTDNGRMARLWHSAILTAWKPMFEFIPIESQIEKFQDGYYNAIARCHIDGESTVFIEFILEQISTVLNEILNSAKYSSDNLSEYVKRLLSVMEYDTPYTATAILSLLNLKSKETHRKNYLNPAIENGLVTMTLPDKPNSRNQRYIKI